MRTSILLAAGVALGLGCGDSGGSGGGGGGTVSSASGKTTAATGSVTTSTGAAGGGPPAGACVQPGEPGNENGVGEYCTPGGGQCSDNPLAPLCLADVGEDQWFCTRIGCNAMTNCGADAGCLVTPDGSACLPCKCEDTALGCGGGPGTSAASSSATTGGG